MRTSTTSSPVRRNSSAQIVAKLPRRARQAHFVRLIVTPKVETRSDTSWIQSNVEGKIIAEQAASSGQETEIDEGGTMSKSAEDAMAAMSKRAIHKAS